MGALGKSGQHVTFAEETEIEILVDHRNAGASSQTPRSLHAARVSIFCDSSRNCRRKTLPTLVFGSSVLNSTSRGTL